LKYDFVSLYLPTDIKLMMKNRLFAITLFVLFVAVGTTAQGSLSDNIKVSLDKFASVDEMPRFPGCEDIVDKYERERCATIKLNNYIRVNLNNPIDRSNIGNNEALAMFIVDKTGAISNIKILRNNNPQIIACAKRAIESMSDIKWIPGKKSGKNVNIWYSLPIRFTPANNSPNLVSEPVLTRFNPIQH